MTPGECYRIRAAELDAKARGERDPELRAEFENLARGYRRLAQQADRNARTDIVYETPPHPKSSDPSPDGRS
jgi:hypothetical protein